VPDLIDVARPPSPRQLAVDVRSASARAAGLYCVNWSINWAEQSPAYIAQLRDMHIAVLPIVVPSDHPQSVATAIAKLLAWGVKPTDTVAIDLERFSLPPLAWVVEFCQRWPAAGIYCQQNYRAQYQAAKPRFWWLAAWGADSSVPAGWQARQYGSWRSPSLASTLYDASSVSPTLRFWGESALPGGKKVGRAMAVMFELGPDAEPYGPSIYLPGPDQDTDINVVAQGPDTAEWTTEAFDVAGNLVRPAGLPQILQPHAQFTSTGLGLTGPGTWHLQNSGPGKVVVVVHW
jgi:hypothetical protein